MTAPCTWPTASLALIATLLITPRRASILMKAKSPELCYTCHMDVRAQFARPFHHRVNEGLIQCNDCHSPHGTFRPKQLRTNASGDEVCYKCHSEKQGPFVYQHEAKVEGCAICHSPHGSTNQRMLKQNQVNLAVPQLPCTARRYRSAGNSDFP